jgi:hypothetical protein
VERSQVKRTLSLLSQGAIKIGINQTQDERILHHMQTNKHDTSYQQNEGQGEKAFDKTQHSSGLVEGKKI